MRLTIYIDLLLNHRLNIRLLQLSVVWVLGFNDYSQVDRFASFTNFAVVADSCLYDGNSKQLYNSLALYYSDSS